MLGAWMPTTACHSDCGCNMTSYKGCCLECPLEECYYVSGKKPVVLSQFRAKIKERTKRVKELFSRGLRLGQVVSITGESKSTARRLRELPDDY